MNKDRLRVILFTVVLAMIAVPLAVTAGPGPGGNNGNKPVDTWAGDVDAKLIELEDRIAVLEGTPPPVTTTTVVTPTTTLPPVTTTTVPVTTTTLPPSTGVTVTAPSSIQAVVDSQPVGATIHLTGTFLGQTVTPKTGQIFIGPATLDGQDTTKEAFRILNDNITLDSLVVGHYVPGFGHGAVDGAGHNLTIRNSEFTENYGAGLGFWHGAKIINNYVHHNRQIGILGRGRGPGGASLVEGNEISYNNYKYDAVASWEGGGTKFLWTVDLVLRGNWVHHNFDNGLWTDADNTGTLIENNLLEYNVKSGIFHEISYSAIIRNNVAIGNGREGIRIVSSSDVEVYGNHVTAPADAKGIHVVDSDRGTGNQGVWEVRNLWVHDNTFIVDAGYNGLRDNYGTGNVYNRNNRFDFNTYVANNANPFFGPSDRMTWSQWQALGYDLNGSFS